MKIAMIYDTIAPIYHGGYEARGFELAKQLVRRGHAVTVFTRAPQDNVINGVTFVAISKYEPTFDSSGYRNLSGAATFALDVLKAVAGRRFDRFDVVDCNATPFVHVPAAKLLAMRLRAPLVLSSHEALRQDLNRYARERELNRLGSWSLRIAYDTAHLIADTIIASAPSAARGLEREGWRRISATTGGISNLGQPRTAGGKRFVTLSRLASEKRLDTVLRAFGPTVLRHRDASLTVIGDGPTRSALESLARVVGPESIRFMGSVDETTKARLLQEEADYYVSGSRREGLSVATLEAMAFGCAPIISVDPSGMLANGAAEYVTDGINGLITDGTEGQLADAMLCASGDPRMLPRLSRQAVLTASEFTWSAAATELEKIYSQAIRSRNREPLA